MRRLSQLLIAAVEDQQIGVEHLLHHELAHVLEIDVERRRVDKAHDLIEDPVRGQTVAVERLHHPHAVVLDDDLLGAVLLLELFKQLRRQLRRIIDRVGKDVAQHAWVILQLALLAADQQRPVLLREAVAQDAVDEAGLAGIEKAGDEINRNIHRSYRPKSCFRPSSFRFEPITHRRTG